MEWVKSDISVLDDSLTVSSIVFLAKIYCIICHPIRTVTSIAKELIMKPVKREPTLLKHEQNRAKRLITIAI